MIHLTHLKHYKFIVPYRYSSKNKKQTIMKTLNVYFFLIYKTN